MNKETINNWKDGDVFLWSYNEVEYEARKKHLICSLKNC